MCGLLAQSRLFFAWLAVMVISSLGLYVAENGINPNIHNPWDALWWGIVTLTSVGYGDIAPVTPEGKIAGAALMILGITLFAAITGTITSYIIAEEGRAVEPGSVAQIKALGALLREGLLTDDEFTAKKTELLARL